VGVLSVISKKSDALESDGVGAAAKASRTTITPTPGVTTAGQERTRRSMRHDKVERPSRPSLTTAREPIAGARALRIGFAGMIFLASAATAAGAVLMLLLWMQHRDSGVLTTQIDRAWELFDHLRTIERLMAFAIVPMTLGWIVLATLNVRRATGERRNPLVAAGAFLAGVVGIWFVGAEMIATAEDWVGTAVGIVFQTIFVALVLLSLERIAESAEARRRGLHVTAVMAVVYLAHLQGLGGVSNIERTDDPERWGLLGAYLVIGALIQAARGIEEGSTHRYELRSRFGESLLSQAALDHQHRAG
jgi:hypothetical protein